ncbi:hypothetical protein GOV12_02595, partial [Candidatus Pacearchaeota archaeon]|nr:hypothetical protein [Candidatus Pacearchaeota archaeon]
VDSGGKAVVGTDSKVSTGSLNTQNFPAKTRSGLSGALGDVIDHSPQPGEVNYDSNNYGNPATKAHEETHGINSNIANLRHNDGTKTRGFYLLNNKKAILKSPKVTIHSPKNYLPKGMKGGMYYDYLDRKDRTNDPLYIFDEWTAYLNGGRSAVDLAQKGMWKWDRGDAVAGPVKFGMYSLALGMSAQQNDPNYWKSKNGEQFRAFTKFNLERTVNLFNEGNKIKSLSSSSIHQEASQMLNQLRDTNNPQTEAMRNFAKNNFNINDPDWTKRVLGF